MLVETRKPSAVLWVTPLLAHLRRIQPKSAFETGVPRGDTRAFAALRASARGQRFVLQALPHVIPFLGEAYQDPPPWVVDQAMALAQLYATTPPVDGATVLSNQTHDGHHRGESIGKKLGRTNVAENAKTGSAFSSGGEEKHLPTRWERRLQALVRCDAKRLVRDLRGTLGLIVKETGGMTFDDFWKLGHDLVYWDRPEKTVQMRWVTDFYSQSVYRTEQDRNEKEMNDE